MLKAILFDVDDTLLDWTQFSGEWEPIESPRVENVYRYLCQIGQPTGGLDAYKQEYFERTRRVWTLSTETQIAPHVGSVLIEAAAALGVPTDEINMRACLEAFKRGQVIPGVTVFPEATEVLSLLRDRGIRRGIITNAYAPMWVRDAELAQYGLLEYFPECRISSADIGRVKPHPAIFRAALARLTITPQEAIFVGDSLHADIVGAQGVGLRAVWRPHDSTNGHNTYASEIRPDATIANLRELLPLLDHWFPGWDKQSR